MKRIVIILIGLISVAYGQSSPTSAKTRFVNGLYVGTKLDTYFAAADSNAIYWRADSALMAKYKGTARRVVFSGELGAYKAVADTFFTGGYTTRARTKQQIDSLAATKLSPSDSATYFNQVVRTFGTQTINGLKTFGSDLTVNSLYVGKGGGNVISNTTLGIGALELNTSGAQNTAIGSLALNANTSGGNNTAVGRSALVNNTTGIANTALGVESLRSNTDGYENTAIGQTALRSNTSGYYNTAVGSDALRSNTTGINNLALGREAGRYITDGSTSNATGSSSVFIGNATRALADGQTNQIVIGTSVTGNGSNTVTIGNSSVTDNYFNGNIRGGAFIKSGGTSSQFLKADGSVDGTAYGTGSVTSVSAGTGMSFTTITSSGAVNADTTVLATRAYTAGLDVGKANTSLNNVNGVLSSTYGGAGSVSGILKANGSGVVSAAVAGTDYVAPSALSDYVTLATTQTISGSKTFTNRLFSPSLSINNTGTFARFQLNGVDGQALAYLYNNSGTAGNVQGVIIEAGTNTSDYSLDVKSSGGTSYLKVRGDGQTILGGALSGTSLSMSGAGSFGGNVQAKAAEPYFLAKGTTNNSFRGLKIYGQSDGETEFAFSMANFTTGEFRHSAGFATYGGFHSWYTNGAEAARLTSSNELLINTTTTDGTNKLIVNGGVKGGNITSTGFINSGTFFTLSGRTSAYAYRLPDWEIYNSTGGNLNFSNYSIDALSISSSGAATFSSSSYAQGYRFAYASKSSNYTLTDNDDYINVTSSCTITLPTAVGRAGKRYVIKCIGSVTATIASTSSETIDGNSAGTYTFGGPNFNVMIVYSNGTNWNLEAWSSGI